ncbi:MAG TPA: sugar ABC transporter substrate-binding protein [Candidatus Limnocylindrales bacterium]|nr:sugar ABC transporter substrate-binding protein [Candidatus Limnocylindrales bacterium]
MNARRFTLPILALVVLLTGASCTRKETPPPPPPAAKPQIAFVYKTLSNPYFVEMDKGVKAAAQRLTQYQVTTHATQQESDVEQQLHIIEDLITRHVAAICLTPNDSKALVTAVAKANTANIPVIIVDTKLDPATIQSANARVASTIASDNVQGGALAAKFIAKRLSGRGDVAILEGLPGQDTAVARKKGFVDAMKQYPNIKIVSSQTAEWSRDKAVTVFQNVLRANPRLNAVFASNDEMALGAIQAIKQEHRTGVFVVGFDATPDGRTAVTSGEMAGTVAQAPSDMGRRAVEAAATLVGGGQVPAEITIPVSLVTPETKP